MRHHNLQVTGSVVVNGLGVATTADLNTYTASADAKISTLQAFTASTSGRLNSIESVSASNIARINSLETTSASVDTLNTTQNNRLNSIEIKTGSLATTGSNTFIGTQTITGSLFISANLIVQGTSSLENITASAVSIGTNIVNLNTANPAIRYAGLVIGDSGSIGSSGSFLYDSVQDEMIFVHRGANTTVTSSVLLMGPQTYDNIGSETYPTSNIIQKGTGNEHLVDSCIFDNGTTTCIKNNFVGTGTGIFCGQLNSTGNADTSAGLVINNPLGSSGVCQHYINFTAGATTIARMFRGNGASGATANGLNIDNFGGFQVRLNQLGGSGDSFNILGGNIGINTCTPSNLLHIEASNNTTNQFRVNSCDGLNAGVRSYTTSDGPGLLINHYYAVSGVPYLRTSDFVSNQGDGASTQMRFFTKDYNVNPALAMIITSGRSIGIGTSTPTTHASVPGLVVSGLNSCRGIIEVWDGACGKAVIQQVGGTTYIGNLDKGTSGGSLRLLVNGSGTSATEAMIINCASRVLINNSAAVGTGADYSRVTISGTCAKTQLGGVGGSILHLSSCENDTPFGAKFTINGNANSCLRYLSIQTGDHAITNQGNIVFQEAGGHVGIGTTSPNYPLHVYKSSGNSIINIESASGQNSQYRMEEAGVVKFAITYVPADSTARVYFAGHGSDLITLKSSNVGIGTVTPCSTLDVRGTITNGATVGSNSTIDVSPARQSIASGGFVDFPSMSGMIVVNDWTDGTITTFLAGGGSTAAIGSAGGQAGTLHYNGGVAGYRWCNNKGYTANFGFLVFKTRITA